MPAAKTRAKTITLIDIDGKLDVLTEQVQHLRQLQEKSPQWWHEHAGRFEGDSVFDQIVRLGRQQRNRRSPKSK
jgi:hypothetical protein